MPTLTKAILMTIAALAVGLLICFGGMLFWINSDHARGWIASTIDSAIPGAITIDDHRLALVAPRLDVHGLTLFDPQGVALAGVGQVTVQIDWWALWHREIRFTRILLEKPWADLKVAADSGFNLMAAVVEPGPATTTVSPADERTGLPFNIVADTIQLIDGRLSFTPQDPTTRIDATGLYLKAGGNLMTRSADLQLSLANLRLSATAIQPEPARVSLNARLEGNRLQVSELEIMAGESRLTLAGVLENLDATPRIDAVVAITGQLTEWMSAFQITEDYAGTMNAELTINGNVVDPHARLNARLDGLRVAGQPIDQGECRITLQDRRLSIDTASLVLADGSLSLNGAVDLRSAFPKGLFAGAMDIDAIDYAIDLDADIPDLHPWLKRLTDLNGRMTGRLSLSGQGIRPENATAALTLKGAAQNLLAVGMDRALDARVDLTARMDRGLIAINRLEAGAGHASLAGTGSLQLPDRAVAMNLALNADDLSRPLAVMGWSSIGGGCQAAITASGTLDRPRFTVALAATDLVVDDLIIGDLTVEADLEHDGRLMLTTLSLENQGSRIQATGTTRLLPDGRDLDPAFINNFDLVLSNVAAIDFVPEAPVRGTLNGRLQASGPPAALAAEMSLVGSGLRIDTLTLGDIDAQLRWNAGAMELDRCHLSNQDSGLSATGTIQLTSPGSWQLLADPAFALTVASDHLDPAVFVDGASGKLAFDAALSGTLKNPIGNISLVGHQVRAAGQPLASVVLDARLGEQRLWVDRLEAAVIPDERIESAGWVGLDRTFDLRLTSTGIAVSRIESLEALFPGEGILRLDVTGSGTIDNPDVDGRLTLTDVTINHEAIDDFDVAFALHDGLIRAKGNLNFALDAACDLNKGDFNGQLTFDRTETAAYFKAAGQPALHGTLSGAVQAAGNIRNVANMSAEIDLNQVNLFYKETPLVRSDRISGRLADQTLTIPGIELALLSTGRLKLSGDARIGGEVNMAIDGHIPVSAAKLFDDAFDGATGMLALAGTLAGDVAHPQIDIRVDMEKIGMTVPGLVQKIHDLNGRISLTGDRIQIDGVKGYLDSGSFQVDGTLAHDRLVPGRVNLTMVARSLPLEIPDTLTVLLNGDITITAEDRTANAKGGIVLLEGMYYKDVKISLLDVSSAMTTRQRTVEPVRAPLFVPGYDTVNLDISVGYRQPFSVENNLAQLEITPDLRVGGSLANPILSGRAQVREGQVIFQKKTFAVQKGVVDFINPYRTEADIDIQSQTQIRTWRINLGLKGTPDNLAVTLTSDPSETRSDILSLILFGQTSRELAGGEGVAQRTTSQIMAEMIADTFGVDIKKTTGLDILQVETIDGDDQNDVGGVKVTMGKHLSDRMTVKYALETKNGEAIQRAITEYKLLEHILVSGFQDNQGVYGSELAFRIEFR